VKVCKCSAEQIEVPTHGDTGTGRMPYVCSGCGQSYSEPYDWKAAFGGESVDEVVAWLESDEFRAQARRLGVTAEQALRL
jgi:predicted Fe-S protein YdhL (DUF1289 family)